jgi:hypothetical protein
MRTFRFSTLLAALALTGVSSATASDGPAVSRTCRIPLIDFSQDSERHVIVAPGTESVYQGHPTTVLLPEGKAIFAVWTYEHGGVCGPMKKSADGGKTWSDLLPVPDSWRKVYDCPAIYRLVDPSGRARLFVFATRDENLVSSYSRDAGRDNIHQVLAGQAKTLGCFNSVQVGRSGCEGSIERCTMPTER